MPAVPPPLPVEENLALARIAERVTKIHRFNSDDLFWMSKAVGISATIPEGIIPSLGRVLGTPQSSSTLPKSAILGFLLSAYRSSPERFPRLLELLFQHALVGLVSLQGPGRVQSNPETIEKRKVALQENRHALEACTSVLGFGFVVETDPDGLNPVQVHFYREEGGGPQRTERSQLHHILELGYAEELTKLQGAYERYTSGGPDAYREAIDSCRSAFEFFFRKLTGAEGEDKWSARLTEFFPHATLRKFIADTYSYLSGGGTHSPHRRELAEALLAIRATEGVMVSALMWCGKW
jgi:hypothetical protein